MGYVIQGKVGGSSGQGIIMHSFSTSPWVLQNIVYNLYWRCLSHESLFVFDGHLI